MVVLHDRELLWYADLGLSSVGTLYIGQSCADKILMSSRVASLAL